MARNRKEELKAKEAKQKKILGALCVVLVLVAVIQVPKLMHKNAGNAALVAATPTATDGTATTPTPATGAPPSLAAAPPVAGIGSSAAPASGAQLADATVTPGDGQLVQFGLFATKDPFVQQVVSLADQAAAPAASGGSKGSTTTSSTDTTATTTPTASGGGGGFGGSATTPAAPAQAMSTVAMISVNGTVSPVPAAQDFPVESPLFHLLSFDAGAAKVTIAGGSYSDGRNALTLAKGVPVTLQNTVDGTRYKLVYHGSKRIPTSDVPKPPSATTTVATTTSATPTTPAPTTPTPTTTTGG